VDKHEVLLTSRIRHFYFTYSVLRLNCTFINAAVYTNVLGHWWPS